ncbi:MAG: zf-HC2 domain-containing protein [Pseudomonadota bacterium]
MTKYAVALGATMVRQRIDMLTCKHATKLISRQQDGPVPLHKRVALRLHLMMCSGCRNYRRQIRFLRRALHRLGGQ